MRLSKLRFRPENLAVDYSGPLGSGTLVCRNQNQFDRVVDWSQSNERIQDVLFDMSDDERERLLTGCSRESWDDLVLDEVVSDESAF